MDPFSQFITTHQYQDQAMMAFSSLFSNSSEFFPGANKYQQQQLPLIPEINSHFFFPIDQEYLPYSIHLLQHDHEVPITPTPAILPQQLAEEEAIKKKHHNASERMRRSKLTGLFATLSSLLPGTDKKKKHTAPGTVERVVNYIPELRNQVERLAQRKQQLLTPTPTQKDVVLTELFATSVTSPELGKGLVTILFSAVKTAIIPISYVLRLLEEEDGVNVVGVSSSELPSGRLFYHIHLHLEEEKGGGSPKIDLKWLRTKLLSSSRKWDEMSLSIMIQHNSSHPHDFDCTA